MLPYSGHERFRRAIHRHVNRRVRSRESSARDTEEEEPDEKVADLFSGSRFLSDFFNLGLLR